MVIFRKKASNNNNNFRLCHYNLYFVTTNTVPAMDCGVPQGSNTTPLLFSKYMSLLSQVIQNHDVYPKHYISHTQVYGPFQLNNPSG